MRWTNWFPKGLSEPVKKQESYFHYALDILNRDYHMKAAGYWIRTHASRENDLVVIAGSHWHVITAEYYFGTPWVSGSRPMPKRLFWRKRFPYEIKPHTAYARRETFIQDAVARRDPDTGEWEPYSLVSDGAHLYVVVIHDMDLKEAGISLAVVDRDRVESMQETVRKQLGLKEVGSITSDNGRVKEVSIYSTRDMPFVAYSEGDARRRFDREYATLRSIANNVYLGMFKWHNTWD